MGGIGRRRHRAVVFAGPSIPLAEATALLPRASLRGPAALGDVHRAVEERPAAILLIDGYYERVPAVWHKELLWALAHGIPVFGAASMGALRAVEMAPFGMRGLGAVYADFAAGVLDGDDEVAVFHAPADSGFRPLSEALVNVRATVAAARGARVLSEDSAKALISAARAIFYPERTYEGMLRAVAGIVPEDEQRAFSIWLKRGCVDRKRDDARLALETVGVWLANGAEPRPPVQPFEQTSNWRQIVVDGADSWTPGHATPQ